MLVSEKKRNVRAYISAGTEEAILLWISGLGVAHPATMGIVFWAKLILASLGLVSNRSPTNLYSVAILSDVRRIFYIY